MGSPIRVWNEEYQESKTFLDVVSAVQHTDGVLVEFESGSDNDEAYGQQTLLTGYELVAFGR